MTNTEKAAAGMLDMLTTFVARYEVFGEETRSLVKKLLVEHCIGYRAHEATFGQFLAQLDHIIQEEESNP
jgi:hypothetical protein